MRRRHSYQQHTLIPAILWLVLACLSFPSVLVGLTSCSDDDQESFPSLITEMADVFTNNHGQITNLLMDDSTMYRLSNDVSGFQPNAGYRCLCGFVPGASGYVELLSLAPAYVLYDCRQDSFRAKDPIGVVSVWRGGCRYLNMYLRPKTRGGVQEWGYLTDSVRANAAGGSTYYLALLHGQGTDTLAYSQDLYMSISLDSIAPAFRAGDSIRLAIETWTGLRHFSISAR